MLKRTSIVGLLMAILSLVVAGVATGANVASSGTEHSAGAAAVEPEHPACADRVDNDHDGKADFPADPGCTDANDNDETDPPPAAACSDGADNDHDGKADFPADPGCTDANDNDETDPVVAKNCEGGDDPGLLTPETIGQQVYDRLLSMIGTPFQDPERNGPITGPLNDGLDGTQIEVVGDEVTCVGSVLPL